MKSLTTTSKVRFGGLILLLAASVSLTACSANSSAQDSRLAARTDLHCTDYQGCVDADGFIPFDNPGYRQNSPGANFGRWMAGGSD
jgi:hypothetical protein